MEDVLETYARPRDERRPVVCVDEGGKQLIGDARPPLPTRPKHPAREDHEYVRNGRPTCSSRSSHWPAGGTSR